MKKRLLHAEFYVVLTCIFTICSGISSFFTSPAVAQTSLEVPFFREWAASAHADTKAEAFRHWDEEKRKQIPEWCARCHSTSGYLDFIGADGSEAGKVDLPAPLGSTVECIACHNEVTANMHSVVMPSGVEITGLGDEARCMQCHQGRSSKAMLDETFEQSNLTNPDTVSPNLIFVNIHNYAAAATKYGTIAQGGYEYEGKSYDAYFAHVGEEYDSCMECHDPHTLKVKIDECRVCHKGVTSESELKNIRMAGSLVDYDGDGNLEEGVYYEIARLQSLLYQAIQAYTVEITKTPMVYALLVYPQFFLDTNKDGKRDMAELQYENKYNAWTPRLLKAAYNYQVSKRDPGMFAHGGKYIIQLLYDSIEDLNTVLSDPIDLTRAHRIDDGHFAGSEEAFRHWDEDGEVPPACSKCHSAEGLPLFLKDNTTISQPPANGFECRTCHNDLTTFTRYAVKSVKFPSGAIIDSGDQNMNLCMNCHQGRVSTVQVNEATNGLENDVVSEKLKFINIHNFEAGATKFGTEAKGGYEYEGKEYVGLFEHVPNYTGCTSCHSTHQLKVKVGECTECHQQVQEGKGLHAIRLTAPDYDGDGNTTEGVAEELDALRQALYAAIQEYAKHVAKADIVYGAHDYPCFFTDLNGNGQADSEEVNINNSYHAWTPKLLKAAYNYQYATEDPGGFAHNNKYIAQLLYDSLESLSAIQDGMIRP